MEAVRYANEVYGCVCCFLGDADAVADVSRIFFNAPGEKVGGCPGYPPGPRRSCVRQVVLWSVQWRIAQS